MMIIHIYHDIKYTIIYMVIVNVIQLNLTLLIQKKKKKQSKFINTSLFLSYGIVPCHLLYITLNIQFHSIYFISLHIIPILQ